MPERSRNLSGPPNRVWADIEEPGNLGDAAAFFVAQPPHFIPLLAGQGRGPAADPPGFPGRGQPLPGSLRNPLALELGDGGKDVEDEATGRSGRVDILGQGPETGLLGSDSFDDGEKVLEGAGKPVVLRDGHDIAGSELID